MRMRYVMGFLLLAACIWLAACESNPPQILGTPEELDTYPPICVTPEEARTLITTMLNVATQIGAHNGTVDDRHGDGTVKRECPEP